MKREYYRHLPHQVPEGFPVFVTWNLKGSMPKTVIDRLRQERIRLDQQPPRDGEIKKDRAIRQWKTIFALADGFLDQCNWGPLLLRNSTLAQIVEDAIVTGTQDQYELWAWCIMANHVHVLLTPQIELARIMQRLKGGTSFQINRLQQQGGRTVWQDESYDHWARDDEEMIRIMQYIENNPVKAGLCDRPADWSWSSARFRGKWKVGEPYVG